MKILIWSTSSLPNIGGLETMTHELAKQLTKRGHQVLVISNNVNSVEFQELTLDGIRICLFPFVTALLNHNLLLIKNILNRAHQVIDDFLPDVVNIHGWFESFAFYQTRIFEKRKTPLCITVHGLLEQAYYNTQACLKLWSKAKAVNTVSNALKYSLECSKTTHSNLRVIYNGLAKKESLPVLLKTKPPWLLMIGRLSEEKCFDIGFRALKILVQKYPDIKLTLVGGGIKFSELSALKTELGLENNIEMTDYIPPHRVTAYIDEASMVLIPSYYESFCLVALEAALRERPVVASHVYGLKEVVKDQVTGILVPPHKPQEFAKAVDFLLRDEEKMKTMGKSAFMRAVDLFCIEKTTHEYLKMYEEIRGE